MHPILSDRARLGPYLLAWGPLTVLLAAVLVVLGGGSAVEAAVLAVPLGLILAFVCLAAWVPCRAYPLGGGRIWEAVLVHLATAVVTASAWAALGRGLAAVLSRWPRFADAGTHVSRLIVPLMMIGTLVYLLSVAVHYLLVAVEASHEAERRSLETSVAARNLENALLRTQLNPHFLFNCLNSIAALCVSEPDEARAMCVKLGDFLRATLRLGGDATVPLATELDLVGRYVEIERTRFGERLDYAVALDDGCGDLPVPALVLQPLIENAIKHGVASLVEGGTVSVSAGVADGRLRVQVGNTFDPESRRAAGEGAGIDIVRGRLRSLYGSRAALRLREDGHRFEATLILPVEREDR